jgi:hypothetical protein
MGRDAARAAVLIVVCLLAMSASSQAAATTLTTPVVEAGPLTHNYYTNYVEEWVYGPDGEGFWTSVPTSTEVSDYWCPQTDGPSFTPDLSWLDYYYGNYYDSVTLSLTAGPGKKFVVDPPVDPPEGHYDAFGMDVWVLFSLRTPYWGFYEPPSPPDWASMTLLGPSGEIVLTTDCVCGVYEDPEFDWFGESIVAGASLPITQHLEFSSIEITFGYSVWPESLLLEDAYADDPYYTLRADGTGIEFWGYAEHRNYDGPPDPGPIAAIVPIPEPGSVLLLGLGGLLLRRRTK